MNTKGTIEFVEVNKIGEWDSIDDGSTISDHCTFCCFTTANCRYMKDTMHLMDCRSGYYHFNPTEEAKQLKPTWLITYFEINKEGLYHLYAEILRERTKRQLPNIKSDAIDGIAQNYIKILRENNYNLIDKMIQDGEDHPAWIYIRDKESDAIDYILFKMFDAFLAENNDGFPKV
jgi:hypothetical protein